MSYRFMIVLDVHNDESEKKRYIESVMGVPSSFDNCTVILIQESFFA